MKPSDREQIVKTGVKHLHSLLDNIKTQNLPREKANQVIMAKKTVAQALPKLKELKGKGIIADTAKQVYAYLTGKDAYNLTAKDKRLNKEFEKQHFNEGRQAEREKKRRARELKIKADAERKALFDRMNF